MSEIGDWNLNYRTNNGVLKTFQVDGKNQLTNATPAGTQTYDANGNGTGYTSASGNRSYDWDAEDRLVKITQGALTSEFTYDGFGRRVKIVEKNNGAITSTKQFVWAGSEIAEERDGANTVTKRFYSEGVRVGTANYFYTRDHLGSVREVTDGNGTVRARYDYDPYGRVTKVAGDLDADFRYTGHYYHAPSGLHLALYRAYDADTGRWLNRDPIGEFGGINLFAFLDNHLLNQVDIFGLAPGDRYPSRNAAAKQALLDIFPLTQENGLEYAGTIYQNPDDGSYSYTEPTVGTLDSSNATPCPTDKKFRGIYHSHPALGINKETGLPYRTEEFSFQDKFISEIAESDTGRHQPIYVITPSKNMLRYDPNGHGTGPVTKYPNW